MGGRSFPARSNLGRSGIPSAGDWIPLLYGVELLSSNPRMSPTPSPPYITLSCLIPMAETSHSMAELADGLIIWFPANNRNSPRSESLVHLFLGRALCLSHHFRDLANQELPRPYQRPALTGRERLRLAQLSQC